MMIINIIWNKLKINSKNNNKKKIMVMMMIIDFIKLKLMYYR